MKKNVLSKVLLALFCATGLSLHAAENQTNNKAVIDYQTSPDLNPFLYPRVGVYWGMGFSPKLTPSIQSADQTLISPYQRFGIKVDMPVSSFFSSGFLFDYNHLSIHTAGRTRTEPGWPDMTSDPTSSSQPVLSLSLIGKFFYDFSLGAAGHMGFYAEGRVGVSNLITATFAGATNTKTVTFHDSYTEKEVTGTPSYHMLGIGLDTGISGGLEYYPMQRLGLFGEGGIEYKVLFQSVAEGFDFHMMQLFSPVFSVGIKWVT